MPSHSHVLDHTGLRSSLLLCLLFCWLAAIGCGYRMLHPLELQSQWQPVFIDARGELKSIARREFLSVGIPLTQTRSLAGSVLSLQARPVEVRSLSISMDGRDAELMRSLEAALHWRDGTGRTLAEQALRAERTQLASPGRRTAQQREAAELDELLRQDIVRQVIEFMRHANLNNLQQPPTTGAAAPGNKG